MEAGDPDPKLSRLISGSVMEGVSPFSPEIDSPKLTYPTFGKGKSSSKLTFQGIC